jgi:hypothetical protein
MPGLLNRILPRESSFFDLFIGQGATVQEGAKALLDLLEDYTDVPAKVDRIKEIEHRGDTITHDVMTRLNQTFITPLDQEDIHRIASRVDDVLDLIDAAASRLVIYNVDKIRPGVPDLARSLLAATDQMSAALRSLEKQEHILQYCIEINRLENESDRISRTLTAQLFDEEKDPVQIIKWKEIIEVIETAVDKCEDVANVLESVVLKNG